MAKVLIGIQARSTSSRLPGKSLEKIETISMTEHVLDACKSVAKHINKSKDKFSTSCDVVLLIPENDVLEKKFTDDLIVTGSETDVLSRYLTACELFDCDYMVRVTGDCPLISPPLITKHIVTAIQDKLDYCSNVHELIRTYVDGYDVEVISRGLMDWLRANAKSAYDREHVTTLIRSNPPSWAVIGSIIGHIDLSHIKLSVDTHDELEDVRRNKRMVLNKVDQAKDLGHRIYRF